MPHVCHWILGECRRVLGRVEPIRVRVSEGVTKECICGGVCGGGFAVLLVLCCGPCLEIAIELVAKVGHQVLFVLEYVCVFLLREPCHVFVYLIWGMVPVQKVKGLLFQALRLRTVYFFTFFLFF